MNNNNFAQDARISIRGLVQEPTLESEESRFLWMEFQKPPPMVNHKLTMLT